MNLAIPKSECTKLSHFTLLGLGNEVKLTILQVFSTIFMNLFKVFDAINHNLYLAKLNVNGFFFIIFQTK